MIQMEIRYRKGASYFPGQKAKGLTVVSVIKPTNGQKKAKRYTTGIGYQLCSD